MASTTAGCAWPVEHTAIPALKSRNRFLDFNAGIAVCSTGHAHPAVVDAIQRQARELLHYSGTDFYLPIYAEVCERLDRIAPIAGDTRAFLTNSGTEAVEAALKLARHATG